jgi:hypothetical protein
MPHVTLLDSRRRRPDEDDEDFETTADGRKILKDGHVFHVGLSMMDGVQRAVAMSDMARRSRAAFGDQFALSLHQPGFRTTDAAGNVVDRSASERARKEWIAEMQDAWRPKADAQPSSATVKPFGAIALTAGEGNSCTIDGRPGTLIREGDWLFCRPSRRGGAADMLPRKRFMTHDEAQPIKDEAYLEYCDELTNAWKSS